MINAMLIICNLIVNATLLTMHKVTTDTRLDNLTELPTLCIQHHIQHTQTPSVNPTMNTIAITCSLFSHCCSLRVFFGT